MSFSKRNVWFPAFLAIARAKAVFGRFCCTTCGNEFISAYFLRRHKKLNCQPKAVEEQEISYKFNVDEVTSELGCGAFDNNGGLLSRENLQDYANYSAFLNDMLLELAVGPVAVGLNIYGGIYLDMQQRNRGVIYPPDGGPIHPAIYQVIATGANLNFLECQYEFVEMKVGKSIRCDFSSGCS
ncbi:unnamed protein product [Cochlearia groenlandica]